MSSCSLEPASVNQRRAILLLQKAFLHTLLYGGSRSGKSSIIIDKQLALCYLYPKSRHLACRLWFTDAYTSLFMDTLQKNLRRYPSSTYEIHKDRAACRVEFSNGSELWIGGLGDEKSVEKILGREYNTIYFNEVSQIPYEVIIIAYTRLSLKITGFKNRFFYDCNPPSPLHWVHKVFIQKLNPLYKAIKGEKDEAEKKLRNGDQYISLKLNPADNVENIGQDYIDNILQNLPSRAKRRFLYGEFCKMEGTIYNSFNPEKMYIDIQDLPTIEYYVVGIDNTGNNLAAVLIGFSGDMCYLLDEYSAYRETMSNFNSVIYYKWAQYNYIAYVDPASGALINELSFAYPGNNAVSPGIDTIQTLIEDNRFHALRVDGILNCPNTLCEFEMYRYDKQGRIVKDNDHHMDAMRYGIYTHTTIGGSIVE